MLRRRGGHKDVERRTIGHCTTLISETTHRGTPRLRLQAMRPSETMIASAISSCRGKCPRLSVINASKQQSVFRTGYRVVSSSVIMLISLAGLANAGKDAGNDAGTDNGIPPWQGQDQDQGRLESKIRPQAPVFTTSIQHY